MSELKEIAVKKITLQIGRKEIELTPEEAGKLLLALESVVGKAPGVVYWPYPVYTAPTYINTPIYCGITSGNSFQMTVSG